MRAPLHLQPSPAGFVAEENGMVRNEWHILLEDHAAKGAVLGESAVADLRNVLQMLRGPGLDIPAITRRVTSAVQKLEAKAYVPCDHAQFVAHTPPVGGRWDDHVNEPGQCLGCQGWFIRTTWATRDECEYTPMRRDQLEKLEAIEARYRRADAT